MRDFHHASLPENRTDEQEKKSDQRRGLRADDLRDRSGPTHDNPF
jgi:hypothetical protein